MQQEFTSAGLDEAGDHSYMNIIVGSEGQDLDAPLGSNFARSRYYLVVDVQTMDHKALTNPWATTGGGAGIQAAQMIAGQRPEAVLTGMIGPNAFAVLEAAGVPVFSAPSGTVRSAIQAYRSAHLLPLARPNAAPHAPFQHLAAPHADVTRPRSGMKRRGKGRESRRAINEGELARLKARATALQEELSAIQARIHQMESHAHEKPE